MSHLAIKTLHVGCVVLSVGLFVLRAILDRVGRPWRQWPVLRIAPHVIDTVLLGSALWLAFAIRQYPFVDAWLTAKVVALAAYIGLGWLALSPRAPRCTRSPALAAALVAVGYIIGVALTRSPSLGLG